MCTNHEHNSYQVLVLSETALYTKTAKNGVINLIDHDILNYKWCLQVLKVKDKWNLEFTSLGFLTPDCRDDKLKL